MNPFEQPTPEQIAELQKQHIVQRSARERKLKTILPCLLEARRGLREAAALGCAGPDFESARRSTALLIDDIETELVRPA